MGRVEGEETIGGGGEGDDVVAKCRAAKLRKLIVSVE